MNRLILITGPAGVGKSTISKLIANDLEKSALIEGDTIYSYVASGYISPWLEGNHLPLFWNISINTVRSFLENGYHVVYNYIITPNDFLRLKEEFKDYNIQFIVLLCNEETILKRDSLRPLDSQMKDRCTKLLKEFYEYKYDNKYIYETSNLNIYETLEKIKKKD